jgi:TolB-like protein
MRLLLLFALLSPAALAAGPQKTLAVLEFRSKLAKDAVDVGYLSDVVRTAAKDAVPELKVMTRENMFVLLQASGKKMEDCEGECEVDTGRRVGADLVISGDVLRFGTQFKVNMKMHDTHTGELLQGAQASGGTLDELDRNLNESVVKLLAPLGARPSAARGTATASSPAPAPLVRPAQPLPERRSERRSASRTQEPLPPEPSAQAPLVASREEAAPDPGPKAGFGWGVFGMLGYYNWSVSASTSGSASPGGSASISGLTYGLTLHGEYNFGVVGLGLFAQYSGMQYEDTTTLQTASTNGSIFAPMLRLRFASGTALYAAVGACSFTENQGTGLAVVGGLDLPIFSAVAVRAQAALRSPTTSGTTSAGVAFDLTSTIITGEIGVGLLF